MRRLFLFVTAVVALFANGANARAQTSFRVSGGGAVPLSPDRYTDASAPGGFFDIGPVFTLMDRLDLAVSIAHSRFPVAGTDLLDAEAMTTWSLASNFLLHLLPSSSMVRPYVTMGGGLHRLNRTPKRTRARIVCLANQPSRIVGPCPPIYRTVRSDPEVGFGTHVGLGASVALTSTLRAFVESAYAGLLFGDNLRYLPVQLGLRFQSAH